MDFIFEILAKSLRETTEGNILDENKVIILNNTEEEPPKVDTYQKLFKFKGNGIFITQFNSELKKIYPNKNYLECFDSINSFLEENINDLTFTDAYRLINNFVDIMKKEKISTEVILEYINRSLSKYSEYNESINLIQKSSIFNKVNNLVALEFTQNAYKTLVLNDSNTMIYLELVLYEVSILIKLKRFDNAIISLSSLPSIIENLVPFQNLKYTIKYFDILSQIELKKSLTNYNSYFVYCLIKYLLNIFEFIDRFPISSSFFWAKNNNKDYIFYENKEFDKALTEISLIKNKEEIIREVKYFAFNKLPIIYGIREDLISEEYFKEFIREGNNNSICFQLGQNLSKKDINPIINEIIHFVKLIYIKYKHPIEDI